MKRYYLTFTLLLGLLMGAVVTAEANTYRITDKQFMVMTVDAGQGIGYALACPNPSLIDQPAINLVDCVFEFEGTIDGKYHKFKITIHGVSCTQFFKSLMAAL